MNIEVILVKRCDVYLWMDVKCPLCGETHWYSGGNERQDPRKALGSKQAMCNAQEQICLVEDTKYKRQHGRSLKAALELAAQLRK